MLVLQGLPGSRTQGLSLAFAIHGFWIPAIHTGTTATSKTSAKRQLPNRHSIRQLGINTDKRRYLSPDVTNITDITLMPTLKSSCFY